MEDPKKILIIRFSSIGDIVLASPLIRILRDRYPLSQIDFLVKAEFAELVRFNHHLSSVIELRTSERSELVSLRKRIREERYDLILDIHNSLRSRYVRLLSGARNARVVDKRLVSRFLLVSLHWNVYRGIVSVAERYLELLKPLSLADDAKGLEVFIPDATLLSVSSRMSKFKLDRYELVVGLTPSARHFTKRWPMDRFVELGARCARESAAKVLVFGGPEDAEYCGDIVQMINATAGKNAAENLAGGFSLLETAASLDFCDVVVSNDTGVMHLAAARQRKVVALFGSTVGEFGFYPYATEHVVVENKSVPCRPCSHVGLDSCPKQHFRCMKDIPSEDVYEALRKILGEMNLSVSHN